MTTIKDVAQLARVSVSTVSRVINQNGYVERDTYNRVVAAMETLNYKPNAVARGLVIRKTATLGLIVPDVANPFFSDVARGVEDEAIENGYTVILCNTDWQVTREDMYIQLLRGRWVEGAIIVGNRAAPEFLMHQLEDVPFILVDSRPNQIVNAVWSNNLVGGRMATQHLIDNGCYRIVHISGPEGSPSALARREGFYQAVLSARNVQVSVVSGDFRFDGGYQAAVDLLKCRPHPNGIFAANDMMAIAVIQAANEMGIRIPEDVMLVGYDDITMARCVYPSLTTVAQPAYDMGRTASKLLITQLKHGVSDLQHVEFKPELKLRKSTERMS
ncbi:LacI family DNA-binding transcriptional regulator [Alicyclobacillus shizuokensis]|uniref:LacI family DNA-binding transcriptional regulator n=1 Tax=Alicyclobacillus shizuokensis TaxID=392014 RepID=UPI0008368BC0|nr:LacI family DNA-binding transcriptional regulator [Alicyclobacillus shizuokensis]